MYIYIHHINISYSLGSINTLRDIIYSYVKWSCSRYMKCLNC